MIELKLTPENNHYWNNNGAYQQEMERLYSKFVPVSGCSENLVGEVIRAANRLYYEFCNNGNGNVLQSRSVYSDEWVECPVCGGSGYIDDFDETCDYCNGEGGWVEDVEDEEFVLYQYYDNFIKLIRYYFEQKNCKEGIEAIDEVLRIIECVYKPEDYFIAKYDRCMDYVIWCVLNDEDNKELIPEWYTND